jgi:hypothetical protein
MDPNETARRVVRMLMARDGMTQDDLGRVLSLNQQRVSQRLTGGTRFSFPNGGTFPYMRPICQCTQFDGSSDG